jgi:hypothetical protein
VNRPVFTILAGALFFATLLFSGFAFACCGCMRSDCSGAKNDIKSHHDDIARETKKAFDRDLDAFEDWVKSEFFVNEIVPALRHMVTQMNAVAMQHTMAIGMFMDAKNQMETQRLFEELRAEAHKDYVPSDTFCWFGTNVKSLPGASIKGKANALSLSRKALDRQLGNANVKGSAGMYVDMSNRWEAFRRTYCDRYDNNMNLVYSSSGLRLACDHDGAKGPGTAMGPSIADWRRVNRDIDFTRLMDLPRTINFDLSDMDASSDDEQDVVALQENIYGHHVPSKGLATLFDTTAAQNFYVALRSVAAKRSVAEFTFSALVGLKSAGTTQNFESYVTSKGFPAPFALGHTRQYLASILRELYPKSLNDPTDCTLSNDGKTLCYTDIYEIMGENPSYYAQLEILGKKMYQNPEFYAKLYDTPANVARKGVAMRAIELMIDREMYESQLRREMIASVLLSSRLRSLEREVNGALASRNNLSN